MAVTCKICWTGCQGCGRKCKCGWWANMIGIANSMFDLWMAVPMIQNNISDIYSLKRWYTPVEIYDHYVNGVELPEKKGRVSTSHFVSQSYTNTVANFKPTPNPQPKCCYTREGERGTVTVWSRCIYCNNVKMYAPNVCPSYWLETKEEHSNSEVVNNTANENNEADFNINTDNNEHS